ncbi:SDR family oxidoreductase [Microbacterium sp. NRRL B-14842]|uniref:SDR family oxidoreductase n=1 Tax=Microbacterium sp. NRRL B-14842 TaxID=3162881 RepID=UPI003D28566F
MTNPTAAELLARSNRLGADPKNTNYAGGNTSAKGTEIDPVTGQPVELLWVKGSGGDLGTLTENGLAVLRLDRMRALVDVYPGVEREDEMVAAFDYCLHGKGGAAPSIDTAMHGLVDAPHVDHLHPDSGIAIATAAAGEELTRAIFGDPVVWVPWRRPGFQLGLDIAEIKAANPQAIGTILGGHGITAWGDSSEEAEANSLWIIDTAAAYIAEHGSPEPFGGTRSGFGGPAGAGAPRAGGRPRRNHPRARVDGQADGRSLHRQRRGPRLPRLREGPGPRRPRHELPRSLPAHQGQAAPPRPPCHGDRGGADRTAAGAPRRLPRRLPGLLRRPRHGRVAGDPRRGSLIVLVPGVGMFSYGANKQTARVAGEFYVNAINVMRGAEALSHVLPHLRRREVPHRVLGAGGGEAAAHAEAEVPPGPHRPRHRCRERDRQGHRDPPRRGGRLCGRRRPDLDKARAAAAELGNDDVAIGVAANVADADAVQAAIDQAVLAFGGIDLVVNNAGLSLSKPLLETTEKDWDLQHDVMAKGSFLVSKTAARVLIDQGLGGDIIYISSKNSVFAGPNNIAYSATKADQAHQVRLLAVELGAHGIRVNGINPDGVVRGSGIFASGWGANRAATYGVKEEDLGQFYADRTILKREVVPENVADAVYVLTGPELSRTTGLHIPVDSGVAAAFLR